MMNLFVKRDRDSEVEDLATLFDGSRQSVRKGTLLPSFPNPYLVRRQNR
jgi:hypothetical protein